MRRTGIWMSVVGALLTLVGAVTVLVARDDPKPPTGVQATSSPADASDLDPSSPTTVAGTPAAEGPPGTIGARTGPGEPVASPDAPPLATPEQVAELLAGLPLQIEQAATTSGGQPRELPPEEVQKIVEDLLRQLGAHP